MLTDETSTRIKGDQTSQLDQIFTNLKVLDTKVGTCTEDYSDHMPIMINLELIKNDQELTIRDGLTRITDFSIRKAATSAEFLQRL